MQEELRSEKTKGILRWSAVIVNSAIFAWLVTNSFYGLKELCFFLIVWFWVAFLLYKLIPKIDDYNTRKRARILALLFFLTLLMLVPAKTRNGVFAFDLTLLLTFVYDSYFFGELLASDMIKIGGVITGLQFLWIVISVLFTLHIL